MTIKPDILYQSPRSRIDKFIFDEQVADVFPDMVSRSIPGYSTIINMIGMLANRYARSGTNIYDLGCSLGAATLEMRHNIPVKDCHIIAIDNSEAMVKRCKAHCKRDSATTPVTVKQTDVIDAEISNASLVVLNFTLQFVDPLKRDDLIQNIFNGLVSGGVLILSEKAMFLNSETQALLDDLYYDFKRFNGYSELEISQKREALDNVLIRDTEDTQIQRLKNTGFSKAEKWFQCLNFTSFISHK